MQKNYEGNEGYSTTTGNPQGVSRGGGNTRGIYAGRGGRTHQGSYENYQNPKFSTQVTSEQCVDNKNPMLILNAQHNFFKTKMCPHYAQNKCSKGERCSFAHSREELRDLPNLRKTKICPLFLEGKCFKGLKCEFAHGDTELRATLDLYKTSLCQAFADGNCKLGDKCRYAHGKQDLRPTPGAYQGKKKQYYTHKGHPAPRPVPLINMMREEYEDNYCRQMYLPPGVAMGIPTELYPRVIYSSLKYNEGGEKGMQECAEQSQSSGIRGYGRNMVQWPDIPPPRREQPLFFHNPHPSHLPSYTKEKEAFHQVSIFNNLLDSNHSSDPTHPSTEIPAELPNIPNITNNQIPNIPPPPGLFYPRQNPNNLNPIFPGFGANLDAPLGVFGDLPPKNSLTTPTWNREHNNELSPFSRTTGSQGGYSGNEWERQASGSSTHSFIKLGSGQTISRGPSGFQNNLGSGFQNNVSGSGFQKSVSGAQCLIKEECDMLPPPIERTNFPPTIQKQPLFETDKEDTEDICPPNFDPFQFD